MRFGFIIFCFALLSACQGQETPPDSIVSSTHYNIHYSGRLAGDATINRYEDRFEATYQYNDRGRGPDLNISGQYDPDTRLLSHYQITGVNYYKGPVNRQFVYADGSAVETDSVEGTSITYDGPLQLYINTESGSIMDVEYYVQALLRHDGGPLVTYNGAELTLHELLRKTLHDGTSGILYEIKGLYRAPYRVWFLENGHFLGRMTDTFALWNTEYAEDRARFWEAQSAERDRLERETMTSAVVSSSGAVLIENVNVFDVEAGNLQMGQDVLLEEGHIQSVSAHGRENYADVETVIDGTGQTLIPGLIDMHSHHDTSLFTYSKLLFGVTTHRNLGNNHVAYVNLWNDIADPELMVPDMVVAGMVDKAGDLQVPFGQFISNLEEGLEAVDFMAENGYYAVKFYSSIEPEWVPPMAERAKAHGLKVMGHIPSGMTTEEAILAGYDEITHINMFMLNFLNMKDYDTRTPQRFIVPITRGWEIDLSSQEVQDFVALMKENDIAIEPTIHLFYGMFTPHPEGETGLPLTRRWFDLGLPSLRDAYLLESSYITDENRESALKSSARMLEIVEYLHAEGIRIVPGTDSGLPWSLLMDLDLLSSLSIDNADILRMATLGAAQQLGLDDRGAIKPGMKDHLVLLAGNPLETMGALKVVNMVFKDGKRVAPPEALPLINITPPTEIPPPLARYPE